MWLSSCSSTICWRDSSHELNSRGTLLTIIGHRCIGVYLEFYSISLVSFSIFLPEVCCFDYGRFVVSFQVGKLHPSPVVPQEFGGWVFPLLQKGLWNCNGIALHLCIVSRSITILPMFDVPKLVCGMVFSFTYSFCLTMALVFKVQAFYLFTYFDQFRLRLTTNKRKTIKNGFNK